MRNLCLVLFVVAFLGTSLPAMAQHRKDVPVQAAPIQFYSENPAGALLNKFFDPQHFRMGHSYSLSFGSVGGQGHSTGLYTNTMMWQFNQKLAARVDIGFMHNPFGGSGLSHQVGGQNQLGQVFLQNAEVAFRPNEHTTIQFSMRQSPYGSYMSPYGYSPYGHGAMMHDWYGGRHHGTSFNASFGTGRDLFWNRDLR